MNVQPDLFGGSSVVGASRSVQRDEAAQCIGQADILSCAECCGTGMVPSLAPSDPAEVGGYVPCPVCAPTSTYRPCVTCGAPGKVFHLAWLCEEHSR